MVITVKNAVIKDLHTIAYGYPFTKVFCILRKISFLINNVFIDYNVIHENSVVNCTEFIIVTVNRFCKPVKLTYVIDFIVVVFIK